MNRQHRSSPTPIAVSSINSKRAVLSPLRTRITEDQQSIMEIQNKKNRSKLLILLAALLWQASAISDASSLYGTPADLTGTRSTDAGMTGNKNYASDFGVSWEIAANPDQSLTYTYTFFGFGHKDKDISHIVLDVSDDCIDDSCIWNATFNGAPIAAADIEFGDKDGIASSVKFDVGDQPAVYRFVSNRKAVWGHLAVSDGGGSKTCGDWPAVGETTLACSNALIGNGSDEIASNFVARPNGSPSVIPLPASLVFFVSGLASLMGLGFKRIKRLRRTGQSS